MHKIITRLVAILTFAVSTSAFAWGGDGHRIVALIATARLKPEAAAQVKELLGNATLADIASWADEVRNQRKETAPWHYVDIPTEAAAFDEKRDGRDGNNIVDATERFRKILTDKSKPASERAEALKWVVHFIGDMRQSLHATERNGDKGGNTRLVFFLDQPRAVNLHRVWDSSILLREMGSTNVTVFASALNARISAAQAEEWTKGTPETGANESQAVAVKVAYADVPADGPPPKLGEQYVTRAQAAVDGQLQRAGGRLAEVLNRAMP
ncbi:MAG: S1/P1 nuclease [Tepidisphaerales bacterium]